MADYRIWRYWKSHLLRSRIRKNSVYNVIGIAGSTILLLAFTPLLLHQMGTANYGLWTISLSAFGLLGVLELGLGKGLAKFVAEYGSTNDTNALSATATLSFLVCTGMGVLLTAPLFLSAHWLARLFASSDVSLSQAADVIKLVALGLIPLLLTSAGLGVAMGVQRFEIPMVASLAQSGLTVITALAVSYLGGSVTDVVISSLCVLWAVALPIVAIGIRLLLGLGARPLLSLAYLKPTLSFMTLTGLSGLGQVLFSSVDRIAVGAVLDLKAVTYYAVSIGVANKLLLLADVATAPLTPASSAELGIGRPDIVSDYLKRATKLVAVVCWTTAAVMLLLSGPFLRLWLGPDFASHSLSVFRVLIVIYALVSTAVPAYHIAIGIGSPGICAVSAFLGGAGTIALIIILGSSTGLIGTAWANGAYFVSFAIPFYVRNRLATRFHRD